MSLILLKPLLILVLTLAPLSWGEGQDWMSVCTRALTRRSAEVVRTHAVESRPQKEEGHIMDPQAYHAAIIRIRTKAQLKGIAMDKIARVLYPFSGTDAALAILLFPNVEEIYLIDNHTFATIDQYRGRKIPVWKPVGGGYRYYADIDRDVATGPRIIGDLLSLSRRARILSLRLIDETRRGESRHISAVINFDLGDGFGPRTLTYRSGLFEEVLKQRDIELINPQAVIGKAAERVFLLPDSYPTTESLRKHIEDSNGVLVEGVRAAMNDYSEGYVPEISGSMYQYDSAIRRVILPNIRFGYEKGVIVSEYGKNPR